MCMGAPNWSLSAVMPLKVQQTRAYNRYKNGLLRDTGRCARDPRRNSAGSHAQGPRFIFCVMVGDAPASQVRSSDRAWASVAGACAESIRPAPLYVRRVVPACRRCRILVPVALVSGFYSWCHARCVSVDMSQARTKVDRAYGVGVFRSCRRTSPVPTKCDSNRKFLVS